MRFLILCFVSVFNLWNSQLMAAPPDIVHVDISVEALSQTIEQLKELDSYGGLPLESMSLDLSVEGVTYRPEISKVLSFLEAGIFDGRLSYDRNWFLEKGESFFKNPNLIDLASATDLIKILTGLTREERFHPGVFGDAIRRNVISRITKTLAN